MLVNAQEVVDEYWKAVVQGLKRGDPAQIGQALVEDRRRLSTQRAKRRAMGA